MDLTHCRDKVVQYFWDPSTRNESAAPIWLLGRRYDSRYQDRQPRPNTAAAAAAATSPPASPSLDAASPADSAVVTSAHPSPDETCQNGAADVKNATQTNTQSSDEYASGWPPQFLDDLESRTWLTYRSTFPPIPKSSNPNAAPSSFAAKMRSLANPNGFTSDTGWGCMIRSGQSLLANSLGLLQLGRDWKFDESKEEHVQLLRLFADTPGAPFSIHNFVSHGAQACGKQPGEWFGPSATARSLQ